MCHSQQIGVFCHRLLIPRSGHHCPCSKKTPNYLSLPLSIFFILCLPLHLAVCTNILVAGSSRLWPHSPLPLIPALVTGWPSSVHCPDSHKMETEWPSLVGSWPSQQDAWVMGCGSENKRTRQDTRGHLSLHTVHVKGSLAPDAYLLIPCVLEAGP